MLDIDRLIKNKQKGLHHTSDEIKNIVKYTVIPIGIKTTIPAIK